MQKINLPLATSTWDKEEYSALQDVIESGRFTMGRKVSEFEKAFANHFGVKHAVMVNSGSSANLLAIAALCVTNKDKFRIGANIVVPAVSWATTYYPVSQYGMTLRFVDVDAKSLCIDVDSVINAIDENTAAVFAVNLLGQPAELPRLKEICDKYGVLLIEDNCESMGAIVSGKSCGTWGILGTFSSFFSHHISTMEGGVVVTDDEALYDVLRSLRAHGWTRELDKTNHVKNKSGNSWDDLFSFVLPGYNLRPLEMEGALGLEQLKKLPQIVDSRMQNGIAFTREFSNIPGVRIQSGTGSSSWFGFSLVLEDHLSGLREELVSELESLGVETRPIVSGNFLRQPVMSYLPHDVVGELRVADQLHDDGLFFGNHHYDITDKLADMAAFIRSWSQNKEKF